MAGNGAAQAVAAGVRPDAIVFSGCGIMMVVVQPHAGYRIFIIETRGTGIIVQILTKRYNKYAQRLGIGGMIIKGHRPAKGGICSAYVTAGREGIVQVG